jgi:hypothetical protein
VTGIDHPGVGFDFARRGGGTYYDTEMPFKDFSYNVLYNVPLGPSGIDVLAPSSNNNNIYIDVPATFDFPSEIFRDGWFGEDAKPSDQLKENDVLATFYAVGEGIYSSALWQEKYPAIAEYFAHMETKEDLEELMVQINDNLVVNINTLRSGRSKWVEGDRDGDEIFYPPLSEARVDTEYGDSKISNNQLFLADSFAGNPLFADYGAKDFQLSQETAAALGMDWIDMGAIGVQDNPFGIPEFTRIERATVNPLAGVPFDTDFVVWFQNFEDEDDSDNTRFFREVSLWQEIAPDTWEWVNETAIFTNGGAGMSVRAGGTYAVYFHGNGTFYPQFVGITTEIEGDRGYNIEAIGEEQNLPGERFVAPPEGVTKFKVPEKAPDSGSTSSWVNLRLSTYEDITGKVVAPEGKDLPVGTTVEVRRLATAADGHLYWDYLHGGSFAVETGMGIAALSLSPASAEGDFTVTGIAPGWNYALIAHADGYAPTWLGDIEAEDFAPSDTGFKVFAVPANETAYSIPVITLSAPQSEVTPSPGDETTPLPNTGDTASGLAIMLLFLLAALTFGLIGKRHTPNPSTAPRNNK